MRVFFLTILAFLFVNTYSQIISEEEENFAFEVKQLDEFIERFNNRQGTLLREYVQKNFPEVELGRVALLKSLLNQADTSWDITTVDSFISQIADTSDPVFLSFYDDDWYAEVKCRFEYLGKREEATLILKIQPDENMASEWVITGVAQADFLKLKQVDERMKFINPISHATDFLGLRKALADTAHLRSYLNRDYRTDLFTVFVDEILAGNLIFKQVDNIVYHFLQLDGWIFTVEYFNRPSRNSGWLISNLFMADEALKSTYKKQILNLH